MRLFSFLFLLLISSLAFSSKSKAQYIIIPEGDTLMVVAENGIITDISGNYMGKFESDGTVKNGQDMLVGRIDNSTGKIYNVTEDELATLSNNQVLDWEEVLQVTVQNNAIYDGSNNLLGTFTVIDSLKAVFLLLYYF